MVKRSCPLPVYSLLQLEFHKSLRLRVRLHARDKTKGFTRHEASQMLHDLQSDLRTNVMRITPVDWASVHHTAEKLSERYTESKGHRLAGTPCTLPLQ